MIDVGFAQLSNCLSQFRFYFSLNLLFCSVHLHSRLAEISDNVAGGEVTEQDLNRLNQITARMVRSPHRRYCNL